MKEIDSKEINLLQLISLLINWLKKWIVNIVHYFGTLIQLIYKYRTYTIIIFIICLSVGIYKSRPKAKVYKAEGLALIYGSDAQTVREISRQIEFSDLSNKITSLATKLSIPDSVAINIVGIHSYNVIGYIKDGVAVKVDYSDSYPQKDTMYVKMRDRVSIQLLTKNISQVPIIQKAILNYFNSNAMLKTQFESRKLEYIKKSAICNSEIRRIDSLAKISYFKDNNQQLRLSTEKLIVGEQQKQLFYTELLSLNQYRAQSDYFISNCTEPVRFPSNLVVDPKPVNGTIKILEYSSLIAFIISVIVALIIENRKKINNFLKNKS